MFDAHIGEERQRKEKGEGVSLPGPGPKAEPLKVEKKTEQQGRARVLLLSPAAPAWRDDGARGARRRRERENQPRDWRAEAGAALSISQPFSIPSLTPCLLSLLFSFSGLVDLEHPRDFNIVAGHLDAVLKEAGVPSDLAGEVMSAVGGLEPDFAKIARARKLIAEMD